MLDLGEVPQPADDSKHLIALVQGDLDHGVHLQGRVPALTLLAALARRPFRLLRVAQAHVGFERRKNTWEAKKIKASQERQEGVRKDGKATLSDSHLGIPSLSLIAGWL